MDIDGKYYCSKCMNEINDNGICPLCQFDQLNEKNKSHALDIGSLLNNRYQLGAVIGQGGFGITYAAWDETLDIPVALKEYFPSNLVTRDTEYSDDVIVVENNRKEYLLGKQHFLRESRVLAMMKGLKGVVEVHDYFEENNTAYIVMEYIHGLALNEYVNQRKISSKILLEMMKEPIDALISLHKQGILHRDITPSNFLVQESGTIKLIDFGSATHIRKEQSIVVVTEQYAPIEQYQSKDGYLGAWTDVYGLAATLYKVLTGITPQESILRLYKDNLKSIDKTGIKLKSYQSKAIMQGLMVQPEKRIQCMEEFRSRLYNLPLPEEVLARKKIVKKLVGILCTIFVIFVAILINITVGFPLGEKLLYQLCLDGLHIVNSISDEMSIKIPESKLRIPIVAIDEYAFLDCEELREVQFPNGINKIDASAFDGTSEYLTLWINKDSLAEKAVKESGLEYDIRIDYQFEENTDGTIKIVSYNGTKTRVELPSVVDGKIVSELSGKFGYYVSDTVDELILPENITEIEESTFEGSIFEECTNKIKKIIFNGNLKKIGGRGFYESQINEIIFSKNLLAIENEAFAESVITEMNIPEGVMKIGEYAFSGSMLKKVTIPSSIQEVGKGIFANCVHLESVVLPETLTVITDSMFRNSDALRKVQIPKSLEKIEASAFELCDSLEYLVLPDGLTSIGDKAFAECYNLKYIDIPDSVTEIGTDVFSGCSHNLVIAGYEGSVAETYAKEKNIRFDDKGKWMEEVEFVYPGSVNVIWPKYDPDTVLPTYDYVHGMLVHTVTDIAMSQTDVESLRLPLFVEKIGWIAFKESYKLKEIDVPDSVKIIDAEAFRLCENLEHVYIYGKNTVIDETSFEGCGKLTIHGYADSTAEIYAQKMGIPFERIQ